MVRSKVKKKKMDQAYKKALEEIDKEKINELKVMLKATLDAIFDKHQEQKQLAAEIRFLQDDLSDLKAGRLDKLKKRRENDKELARVGKIDLPKVERFEYVPKPYWSITGTETSTAVATTNLAHLVDTALREGNNGQV